MSGVVTTSKSGEVVEDSRDVVTGAEDAQNVAGDRGRVEVPSERSLAGMNTEVDSVEEAKTDADLSAKLLHYFGKLTTTEQADLVKALGKRLACTLDTDSDEVDTEDEEDAEDEEDTDRPRGLAKLMEGLNGYQLECSAPMSVPGPRDVVEAILVDLRRAELFLGGVRETLQAVDFDFQWEPDDLSVERQAGLAALVDAKDTIDSLRAPLILWGRMFQGSRLVALDAEMMRPARELARLIPNLWWPRVEHVLRAALLYLARQADADRIIAEAEQVERVAWDKKHGIAFCAKDRARWPFVRSDGRPWDSVGGGVEDAGATISGAETVGVNGDTKRDAKADDEADADEAETEDEGETEDEADDTLALPEGALPISRSAVKLIAQFRETLARWFWADKDFVQLELSVFGTTNTGFKPQELPTAIAQVQLIGEEGLIEKVLADLGSLARRFDPAVKNLLVTY